ncbi:hypothetical protein Adt_18633 [Abeliophyllum distichum]|uniref:Uncharacterized protein n=1 Tax=Abeliophyllum distichum TaxID=126358 RepID=A0ABD1TKE8_9LAMI
MRCAQSTNTPTPNRLKSQNNPTKNCLHSVFIPVAETVISRWSNPQQNRSKMDRKSNKQPAANRRRLMATAAARRRLRRWEFSAKNGRENVAANHSTLTDLNATGVGEG